jgi:biotin synthase
MVQVIQALQDWGVTVGLFAFTPVRGTEMAHVPPPPLAVYRRMQVARHLIAHGLARADDFAFAPDGQLTDFCRPHLSSLLADGVAFQTSGCPDCNRPYYNERPGGPLYNYPRRLNPDEIQRALAALQDGLGEQGDRI